MRIVILVAVVVGLDDEFRELLTAGRWHAYMMGLLSSQFRSTGRWNP